MVTREDGTVEFSNFNLLKKKSVRGLLRKRAKKYDSDEDGEDERGDSDNEYNPMTTVGRNAKKTVLKNSFAAAF